MIVARGCGSLRYTWLTQRWKSSRSPSDNECFGQPQHEFMSAGVRGAATELHNAETRNGQHHVDNDAAGQRCGENLAAYNQVTNVSLHSCMQSSVPEPYARNPSHVSMPGGGRLRSEKYVYAGVQEMHPIRNLHTSAAARFWRATQFGAPQGVQGDQSSTATPVRDLLNSPCPQGIQGDECSQFKLWLSHCLRHDGIDCQKLANEYSAGRKTLSQIFDQYDREIKAVQFAQKRTYSTAPKEIGGASATASVSETPVIEEPAKALTNKQKLKQAVKDYGSTVIVFHITISLASLGICYLAVSSNIDLLAIMAKLGASQDVLASLNNATTFVIAYAVHKMLMPGRIAITLSATPVIVKYLRAKGVLKAPQRSA